MKQSHAFLAFLFLFSFSYGSLRVDSVTVDSVWSSDSSWYDGNNVLQQRFSRNCRISFIPQDTGMVSCSLAISVDSGRTWGVDPNPLQVIDNGISSPVQGGKKGHVLARVLGPDRPKTVFKIIANTCPPSCAGTVYDLKITNKDISGWHMSTNGDSFAVFTADNFHNDVDGGDKPYTDRGVVDIADEHLIGPNSAELGGHAFFMDFGTNAFATAMFQYQSSQYLDNIAITGYDNTVAFGYVVLGGITVFAHFNKFYVELPFTGYSSQTQAISDAKLSSGL